MQLPVLTPWDKVRGQRTSLQNLMLVAEGDNKHQLSGTDFENHFTHLQKNLGKQTFWGWCRTTVFFKLNQDHWYSLREESANRRPTTCLFCLFRRPCPIHTVAGNAHSLTLQLPSFRIKRKQSREWGCTAFSNPSNSWGPSKHSAVFWTRKIPILLQHFREVSPYLESPAYISVWMWNLGKRNEWAVDGDSQFLHKVAFATWDLSCYPRSPPRRAPMA